VGSIFEADDHAGEEGVGGCGDDQAEEFGAAVAEALARVSGM